MQTITFVRHLTTAVNRDLTEAFVSETPYVDDESRKDTPILPPETPVPELATWTADRPYVVIVTPLQRTVQSAQLMIPSIFQHPSTTKLVMPAWIEFGCTYGDKVKHPDAASFIRDMQEQGIDTRFVHPTLLPCDMTTTRSPTEQYERTPLIHSDMVPEPWALFQNRLEYARYSLWKYVKTLPENAEVFLFTHGKVLLETNLFSQRVPNGASVRLTLEDLVNGYWEDFEFTENWDVIPAVEWVKPFCNS